jgi:hypothetical protein
MARYTASWTSITPTATADTTNLVDSTYPLILQGGNSTMRLNINEVMIGGEASSTSSPTVMVLARDSTVAATVTAGTTRNALMDGSAVAPGTVAVVGHIATTKPQRSATLHLLHLSFNAYGGITRWQARFGEEISTVGNTASLGEVSLSAFTGGTTGATSGHVIYEVA